METDTIELKEYTTEQLLEACAERLEQSVFQMAYFSVHEALRQLRKAKRPASCDPEC